MVHIKTKDWKSIQKSSVEQRDQESETKRRELCVIKYY